MATHCSAWSAGQHLNALSNLASKLERLERQAELLDNLQQQEEENQGYLKAYRGSPHSKSQGDRGSSSSGGGNGCLLSAQVSELKSYIQAVADAELDGDEDMLAITASHAAKYAVQLIRQATDVACVPSKAQQVVTDLAAATLSMLSQRPPAHEVLATAGAVHALLQLLDPMQSPCAVENAAKALGNLSADAACRALIRSSGGVGSLARLLREDCASSMQASSAAALSLLAVRDAVVSDTLRYLGALPLLVELLNSPHLTVTEAARCCLLSLKHNNPRNATEILTCLRSNQNLCKDYWRLKDALLLLGEAPTVPTSTTSSPGAAKSPSPSLAKISISSTIAPLTCSPGSPHHRPKSPVKAALEAAVDDARREVAAAAVHVVEAIEEEVLQKKLRRAQKPLEALSSNLDASIALLKASLADTRAAAAASKAAAAIRSSGITRARVVVSAGGSARRCSGGSAGVLQDAAPKSVAGKHIMRYTCEEVCLLLQRMGLEGCDIRPIRKSNLSGAELLLLSEQQLVTLLDVPLHKARRLRKLQDAVALYDAIATRVAQPRLTEVELRLWLAAQGCECNEAGRAIKLLKNLVLSDPDSHVFTAWEWAAGWTWVQHALEVHGVSWRV